MVLLRGSKLFTLHFQMLYQCVSLTLQRYDIREGAFSADGTRWSQKDEEVPLRIYVNTELVAYPAYDVGREHYHAGTKPQFLQLLTVWSAPVSQSSCCHPCVIGNLLTGHCFHNCYFAGFGIDTEYGVNSA